MDVDAVLTRLGEVVLGVYDDALDVRTVLAAAGVEFVAGTVGMTLSYAVEGQLLVGGLVGAVFGGVAAVALADAGPAGELYTAALADVLSSVAVFAVVLVAGVLLTVLAGTAFGGPAGLVAGIVAAVGFVLAYLLFGTVVAVVVGVASLVVALSSAGVASLTTRAVGRLRARGNGAG